MPTQLFLSFLREWWPKWQAVKWPIVTQEVKTAARSIWDEMINDPYIKAAKPYLSLELLSVGFQGVRSIFWFPRDVFRTLSYISNIDFPKENISSVESLITSLWEKELPYNYRPSKVKLDYLTDPEFYRRNFGVLGGPRQKDQYRRVEVRLLQKYFNPRAFIDFTPFGYSLTCNYKGSLKQNNSKVHSTVWQDRGFLGFCASFLWTQEENGAPINSIDMIINPALQLNKSVTIPIYQNRPRNDPPLPLPNSEDEYLLNLVEVGLSSSDILLNFHRQDIEISLRSIRRKIQTYRENGVIVPLFSTYFCSHHSTYWLETNKSFPLQSLPLWSLSPVLFRADLDDTVFLFATVTDREIAMIIDLFTYLYEDQPDPFLRKGIDSTAFQI